MTSTSKPAAALILCAALLAACGSAPPPRLPVTLERANTAEREARRALRDGDWPAARNLFEQSLRLHQSVDNLPGVAASAISLATVYHRMKNDDMALRLLDGLLKDKIAPYPAELRATAAFSKAVIMVDGAHKEAAQAVEFAAQNCGGSCGFAAGLDNLRARLALAGKDWAAAEGFAKAAADAAGENREELANARRNSAAADAALARHRAALEHYLSALELDKQLGLGARVAEDLDGAAGALKQLGRKEEAASYARRAAAAHDAFAVKADDPTGK